MFSWILTILWLAGFTISYTALSLTVWLPSPQGLIVALFSVAAGILISFGEPSVWRNVLSLRTLAIIPVLWILISFLYAVGVVRYLDLDVHPFAFASLDPIISLSLAITLLPFVLLGMALGRRLRHSR